jgi:hypothetical protein
MLHNICSSVHISISYFFTLVQQMSSLFSSLLMAELHSFLFVTGMLSPIKLESTVHNKDTLSRELNTIDS